MAPRGDRRLGGGNLTRYASLQAYYNLVARELEHELLPLCLDQVSDRHLPYPCWHQRKFAGERLIDHFGRLSPGS